MAEINLQKRVVYAGDVFNALLEAGWEIIPALKFVQGLPKADVAEVRHGHWISVPSMAPEYECSECGRTYEWWEPSEAHFCPGCGADMRDGGADNGTE